MISRIAHKTKTANPCGCREKERESRSLFNEQIYTSNSLNLASIIEKYNLKKQINENIKNRANRHAKLYVYLLYFILSKEEKQKEVLCNG